MRVFSPGFAFRLPYGVRYLLAVLMLLSAAARLTHSQGITLQDTVITDQLLSVCEARCFAGGTSFTTVPYYTMDTPRSLTFAYHEDRAHPRPILVADVTPFGAGPLEYRLSATLDGTTVTFTNGDTVLVFANVTGPVRLAGQFDASSMTTGAHDLTIKVVAPFGSGRPDGVATHSRELVIENESSSSVAPGWMIAGVQHLYLPSVGINRVVTEGTGDAILLFGEVDFNGWGYDTTTHTYSRVYPDGSHVYFNTLGQETKAIDRLGNETDYSYDGSGRLTAVYDPQRVATGSGHYFSLTYGTSGVSAINETNGTTTFRTTTMHYASGRLSAILDPDGDSTSYTYDTHGRLASVRDRRGGVTTFSYDDTLGSWKLLSQTMPLPTGTTGTMHYTPWQMRGLAKASVSTQFSNAIPYPQSWLQGTMQDPTSRTIGVNPGRYGQQAILTFPGDTTITARHGLLPVRVKYQTGGVDTMAYLTGTTYPTYVKKAGLGEVRMRYGAKNQVDSIWGTGVAAAERRFLDTATGRIDSVRVAGTYMTRYTYDARNRLLSTTDQSGHVNTVHYQSTTGNVDSTGSPGGLYTVSRFDTFGRDTASFAKGAPYWTQTRYDTLNRLRKTWHAGATNDTTKILYDALYPYETITPGGHVYKTIVNATGVVTTRYAVDDTTSPTSATTYTYNALGHLASMTNRRGQSTYYTFDALDRMTSRYNTGTFTDVHSYSVDGRRIVSSRSGVTTDTTYLNVAGQPDSVVRTFGTSRKVIHYTYDLVGRVTSSDVSGTAQATYRWNATQGTLDTLVVGSGLYSGATWMSYYPSLGVATNHFPAGQIRYFGYTAQLIPYGVIPDISIGAVGREYGRDSLGRISLELSQLIVGGAFTNHAYTYDPLGRLFTVRQTTANCPLAPADTMVLGANVTGCSGATTTTVDSNTYDLAGNRTPKGISVTYSSTGNRLTTWGSSSYTYDADGNLKTRTHGSIVDTLFWNAIGQLDSLHSGTRRIGYLYNADGLLFRRTINGTVDRNFVWDPEAKLLGEWNGTMGRVAQYIYTPEGRPFALVTDSATTSLVRYLQPDNLGNVIGVTKGAVIQQHLRYTPWGVADSVMVNTIADTNRLGWKELMYEGDSTQLYYVRNRWYDPKVGRFISEDPIGIIGGINLYTFGANDPINYSDPAGTCKVDVRFFRLGPGYYHAYLVTTEPDVTATQMEFRAGPKGHGPASGGIGAVFAGLFGASSQRSPRSHSNSGSSWGTLVGTVEPYINGATDWESGTPPSVRVVDNNDPCQRYNDSFSQTLSTLDGWNVSYNPFTTNSNAAVHLMLMNAGINQATPPVWVPGWDTRLP